MWTITHNGLYIYEWMRFIKFIVCGCVCVYLKIGAAAAHVSLFMTFSSTIWFHNLKFHSNVKSISFLCRNRHRDFKWLLVGGKEEERKKFDFYAQHQTANKRISCQIVKKDPDFDTIVNSAGGGDFFPSDKITLKILFFKWNLYLFVGISSVKWIKVEIKVSLPRTADSNYDFCLWNIWKMSGVNWKDRIICNDTLIKLIKFADPTKSKMNANTFYSQTHYGYSFSNACTDWFFLLTQQVLHFS